MAVDTRDKRASVIGLPGVIYANPDGTIGALDRQQAVGLYAGSLAAVEEATYYFPLSVSHSVPTWAVAHSVPAWAVSHSVPTYSVSHSGSITE